LAGNCGLVAIYNKYQPLATHSKTDTRNYLGTYMQTGPNLTYDEISFADIQKQHMILLNM
jgi:hypothetical protein